jgi:recombination-promoting nuclease RpnC
MKKLTNKPHDQTFRLSLSNKEVAKDFLKTHLPPSILKIINLNTMSIYPNSYITEELEESYSDILYQAKTSNNNNCYVYVLVEHMSKSTWDMPIRMIRYQLDIIESHRRQYPKDRKLPVVVPILVYNGKTSPYFHSLDLIKLFNDQNLAKKTFAKPARLIDLTKMSDQVIKKHNIIALLEFAQKHVRDRKLVKNTIKTLAYIINKLDHYVNKSKNTTEARGWFKDYVNGNLHYLYYFANIIDDKEFTKELERVNYIKRENVMGALARKIEQTGIVKGEVKKSQEIAIAMLKKGLDINLIMEVTSITKEEINKLKDKIK